MEIIKNNVDTMGEKGNISSSYAYRWNERKWRVPCKEPRPIRFMGKNNLL